MAKNTRNTYGIGDSSPIVNMAPLPISARRDPVSTDLDYEIGSTWINTLTNNTWTLTSTSNNLANWEATSASAGGNAPITKYVVDPDGSADYTTIQEALDAVPTNGTGAIYIRSGTYTENLTFPNARVSLIGVILDNPVGLLPFPNTFSGLIKIVGIHTPHTSRDLTCWKVSFESSTHIFSSTAAGTAIITVGYSRVTMDGYFFNLPNWTTTGSFISYYVDDRGSTSSGWINNTAGARVTILESYIGSDNVNPMFISGFCEIRNSSVICPTTFSGSRLELIYGSVIYRKITTSDSTELIATSTLFETFAGGAAISHGSSGNLTLGNVSIDSQGTDAIEGAGTGPLILAEVAFIDVNTIAGTLTQSNTPRIISGGYILVEGTNAMSGLATLVAGAVTVSTTSVTANSRIQLTHQTNAGTPGFVSVTARVVGTSFTITSSNGADTSDIAWLIVEPS